MHTYTYTIQCFKELSKEKKYMICFNSGEKEAGITPPLKSD